MEDKFLYWIIKAKIPSWIKFWLWKKTVQLKYVLSSILNATSFDLTDTYNKKFKIFTLTRNTTQKTTTGRNLLPTIPAESKTASGITLTSNGDGSFTATGIPTATTDILFTLAYTVHLPDQPIYVHLRNESVVNYTSMLFIGSGRTSSPSFSDVNRIMTSANLTDMELTQVGIHVNIGVEVNLTFTPTLELTDEVTNFEEYTGGEPSPSPNFPQQIKNAGDDGVVSEKIKNSDETEEQSLNFPMKTNQKLLGYTADDGLHQEWKEIVLDGTENYNVNGTDSSTYISFVLQSFTDIIDRSSSTNIFCNCLTPLVSGQLANICRIGIGSGNIVMTFEYGFCNYDVNALKEKIAELYQNETPIILQIPLLEEVIENYSQEQQIAYEQMKKLKTYNDETIIYSEDETPAILEIQYYKKV